jgi:hypothetical protein
MQHNKAAKHNFSKMQLACAGQPNTKTLHTFMLAWVVHLCCIRSMEAKANARNYHSLSC